MKTRVEKPVNKYPIRLLGVTQHWVYPIDPERFYKSEIDRAIFTSENDLSIGFKSEGKVYNAKLKRQDNFKFKGDFTYREGPDFKKGTAKCTLYQNTQGYCLFGNWVEEGDDYNWLVTLYKVKDFKN